MPSGTSTWSGVTGSRSGGSPATETIAHTPITASTAREQRPRVVDDPQRRLEPVLDRRGGRERAGEHEPDRRRQHEPGAAAVDDDVRRGQRVQAEEAGADQEREPDQQQPRVAPPPARLADRDRQRRR